MLTESAGDGRLAVRQRRAWAAITQLHTQTRAEGEKDGRLCPFVGFDLAWPVLDSHLGRERVTQHTATNIGD